MDRDAAPTERDVVGTGELGHRLSSTIEDLEENKADVDDDVGDNEDDDDNDVDEDEDVDADVDEDVDVDVDYDNLIIAARFGQKEIVLSLLQGGAEVNWRTKKAGLPFITRALHAGIHMKTASPLSVS